MIPRRKLSQVLAGSLVAVAALAGCGFDDSLTARGFVLEGDQICGETIVAEAFELEAEGGLEAIGAATVLERLGGAYAQAGSRVRALDTHEDDDDFRERMSAEFEAAGKRMRDASAAGAELETQASEVFAETGTFLDELEQRGFRICGGRLGERQP